MNTTKILGISIALAFAATQAQAANYYWDDGTVTVNGTSGGGNGTWNVGVAGWEDGTSAQNWANGNLAVFGGGASSITVGGAISASGLQFSNTTGVYAFTTGTRYVLSVGTSGIDMSTAGADVTLDNLTIAVGGNSQTWNVATGKGLYLSSKTTLNGQLTGNAGTTITVTGGGLVDLLPNATGANAYAGNWLVQGGSTLRTTRNQAVALGTGTVTLDGGTLAVGGIQGSGAQGNWTFNNAISLGTSGSNYIDHQIPYTTTTARWLKLEGVMSGSGDLTFKNSGNGGITMTSDEYGYVLTGANTFTGNMGINASTYVRIGGQAAGTLNANAGNFGSIASAVAITNNGVLRLTRNDAWTFANNISGTGQLKVGGTIGTTTGQVVTVSGTNTYTGATTVVNGRMNLTGSLTSPITVTGGSITGTGSTTGALTLNGGTIALAGGATTTSLTANGVTFSAATALNFLTLPTASTTYDVVTYGAGGVTNLSNLTAAYHGTLSDDTGNQKIVFAAGGVADRTWNTTSGTWDIYTTANFAEGDQKFAAGDTVIFNEPASAITITLSGRLAPTAVKVNNTTNKITFTGMAGTNDITGTASLTKTGAGTLDITTVQTYTGGTTVNGGTLRLQGGGSTGTIRGTLTANSGTTIEIGGIDSLGYSTGADAVRTINLNSATLVQTQNRNETNTAVINMAGGSTISATGGTSALFDMFGGTAALNASGDTTNTISSPIRLRQDNTAFTVADGAAATDLLVSGVISKGTEGNGALVKAGAGRMVLTASNTYTGNTTINGGVLELSTTGKLYNGGYQGSAIVTVNAGGTWRMPDYSYGGVGQLADHAARRVLNGGTIEVTGGTHTSGQDFTVGTAGGTFRYNPANTANTLTLRGNANSDITLNGALTLDTAGNVTVVPITGESGSDGIIAGSGSLTKTGAGTLTLSGINTYNGNTTIHQGTLALSGSGSIASSPVITVGDVGSSNAVLDVSGLSNGGNWTLGTGQTLKGIGTVTTADTGTITIAGTHSPGNSAAIQQINGATTYNSGSTFVWELYANTTSNSPVVYDQVNITGSLTIVDGALFNVVLNDTGSTVSLANAFWQAPQQWQVFSYTGSLTYTDGFTLNTVSAQTPVSSYGSFTFTYGPGSTVNLNWTPVPELSNLLVGGLLAVGLLRRRRATASPNVEC